MIIVIKLITKRLLVEMLCLERNFLAITIPFVSKQHIFHLVKNKLSLKGY